MCRDYFKNPFFGIGTKFKITIMYKYQHYILTDKIILVLKECTYLSLPQEKIKVLPNDWRHFWIKTS